MGIKYKILAIISLILLLTLCGFAQENRIIRQDSLRQSEARLKSAIRDSMIANSQGFLQGTDTTSLSNRINAKLTAPAEILEMTVRNETGSQIAKGKIVYISGFNNVPLVSLADNTNTSKTNIIGITKEAINDESNGQIVEIGLLSGIDTDGIAVGSILYLSTNGNYTKTKPVSGAIIRVGVVDVQDNNGSIEFFVRSPMDYTEMLNQLDTTYIYQAMSDSVNNLKVMSFVKSDPDSNSSFTLMRVKNTITIDSTFCLIQSDSSSPSVSFNMSYGTDRTSGTDIFASDQDITNITIGETLSSFSSAVIPKDNMLWLSISAILSYPKEFLCVIYYH